MGYGGLRIGRGRCLTPHGFATVTIYLVKGYIDVAATSLADAQALLGALADPGDADNAAIIDRVTGKLAQLVQSDSGEPLVISSIDDTAGTISSWVTDASTTLVAGLGDPDPTQSYLYASTLGFSISGNIRLGTLALNTDELTRAVAQMRPFRTFALQLRKTSAGSTQTVGLLQVRVKPGVISGSPSTIEAATYVDTVTARAGYVINLSGITSLTGGGATALDGLAAGGDSYPVGCIVALTEAVSGGPDIVRFFKLKGSYVAASDVDVGVVKPTNSDATTNPVHWKQCA
jgi:hypothetical protein